MKRLTQAERFELRMFPPLLNGALTARAAMLFGHGFDTYSIAKRLQQSEAAIYNSLGRHRELYHLRQQLNQRGAA